MHSLVLMLLTASVQQSDVPRGVATWPQELGNHRARVLVDRPADAVSVHLPWRRRDPEPEKKDVRIIEARSGEVIKNARPARLDRESADVVFQAARAGEYFVYYAPFAVLGKSGEPVRYDPPSAGADPVWVEKNRGRRLPRARVAEFQARGELQRPDPMEVIATAAETEALVARHPAAPYLIFPEDREHPIRMTRDLPLRWIRSGPGRELRGSAEGGEYYVFQIGVFAARATIDGTRVVPGPLRSPGGQVIPDGAVRCFNLGGIDWLGRPFAPRWSVPRGEVRALWLGVDLPPDVAPGTYSGTVALHLKGGSAERTSNVQVHVAINPQGAVHRGDDDPSRLSRLRWLDSTIGLDDEPTAPFTPVSVAGRTVSVLGRQVRFASGGLPESMISNGQEILARPIAFAIAGEGLPRALAGGAPELVKTVPNAAIWEARSQAGPIAATVRAKLESDGYANFEVHFKAERDVTLENLHLDVPLRRELATYFMGLGRKGGRRPREAHWAFDGGKGLHGVWVGDASAGLTLALKRSGDNQDVPGFTEGKPSEWGAGRKGGIDVLEEGNAVVVRASTGARTVRAGEELLLRFALLATPIKPLDPAHYRQRYYHFFRPVPPVEKVAGTGATVVNIHQGNALNPYINYPFLEVADMRSYIAEIHRRGMKAKIYYTARELSNHLPELWALRSLGDEIFAPGPGGGGGAWLREHLVTGYRSAWHELLPDGDVDAAIVTQPLSRWHNYYMEGLRWMMENVGVDGLYLDGMNYDREIIKRMRKVMDRARPGGLLDLHEGIDWDRDRENPALAHMEHLPYLDSIWFGEGFNYDDPPDYWLTEISGIPFGLYGEMLQGGGNPWRGMLYGMTNRLGWKGDPRAIWKVWDDFGIEAAEMIGYWDAKAPVRSGRTDVLCTTYRKPAKALVAVASWAKDRANVKLSVDWKALGLNPARTSFIAPAVEKFQDAARFRPGDEITVEPGRGLILVAAEEPKQ